MKVFKIKYVNGDYKIVKAKNILTIIKRYNLFTARHKQTRVIELHGEQKALALIN